LISLFCGTEKLQKIDGPTEVYIIQNIKRPGFPKGTWQNPRKKKGRKKREN